MAELSKKAQKLTFYCKANNRACPLPSFWNELYELLPNKKRNDKGGWEPALPLILGAWHTTPVILKIMRLQEHIVWADEHGAINEVNKYLRALPEDGWYHLGE